MKFKRTKGKGVLAPLKSGAKLDKSARLRILASELVTRTELAKKLGYSYKGARDIYEILGYEKDPDFNSFYVMYKRGGLAKRIINAPVSTSWRGLPEVSEKEKRDTKFEVAWKKLVEKRQIFSPIRRADKLARIGRYSVLLMGFDDGKSLDTPITKAADLLYLQPYSEAGAEVETFEEDIKSERYGLPLTYKIKMSSVNDPNQLSEKIVHYSRVIHICEDLLQNNIEGDPALECIFNNLKNLELVSGGSAEMFWRGASPGLAFKADEDAQFGSDDDLENLEDEIQEYLIGLKRYLRLQGVSVEQLAPQVSDPANHIMVQVDIIAGTIGIPKRILMGSERGELASSQDSVAWNRMMDERRTDFCEPVILRPLINTLISVGVLPAPEKESYEIKWKSLFQATEHEKALIAKQKTDALVAYTNAIGAETIIPPEMFLTKVMGYSEEEVVRIKDILGHEIGKGREEKIQKMKEKQQPPARVSADPRKLKKAGKVSQNT